MGAHHGGIEHLHQMRRLAHRRQGIEERFESSRSAQPPEPLPHAVPAPEFLRKSPPSNIMNHKIVQASRNFRSFRPLSPRRDRDAANTRNTIVQSSSVMAVSMVGPPKTDCPRVREKVIWESLYPILGSIRPHGLDYAGYGHRALTTPMLGRASSGSHKLGYIKRNCFSTL